MKPEFWTADEKPAIILEGLQRDRPVLKICKDRQITPAQFYRLREEFLASARSSLEMVH